MVIVVITDGTIERIVRQELVEMEWTEGVHFLLTSDAVTAEEEVEKTKEQQTLFIVDDLYGSEENAKNLVMRCRKINPHLVAMHFSLLPLGAGERVSLNRRVYQAFISKGVSGESFSTPIAREIGKVNDIPRYQSLSA